MGAEKTSARFVIGVAGWKNSGKTTLVERLVAELTRRGLTVATVKHAHHGFDVDPGATDSARHRKAGAREVAIVSSRRWAIMHEIGTDEGEPMLADMLARLSPVDVVIAEGFKLSPIPKIEVRRREARQTTPLHPGDARVVAIAADHAIEGATVPVLALDDIAAVADLVMRLKDEGASA
jgi:molybdopterin-guanine dinucleotide biosynthesis protein B